VLAGVVVAELVQLALTLRGIATEPMPGPAGPLNARPRSIHPRRLASAHLFGVEDTAAEKPLALAPLQAVNWALKGVIAMRNPDSGFAILGERGKTARVYKAGAALQDIPGARLLQVFSDHVILEVAGRMESLLLPRETSGAQFQQVAAVAAQPAVQPAAALQPSSDEVGGPRVPPTPAETLITFLNLAPSQVDGKMTGMTLHPGKPLSRKYGFHDGDLVTAINGVDITQPDAVDNAIKSGGQVIALTYTHDGVQQTVNLPVSD
jgi:type II secretion system protein C